MKLLITKVDIRKHPDFSDYLNNLWTVLFSIVFARKFSIWISPALVHTNEEILRIK